MTRIAPATLLASLVCAGAVVAYATQSPSPSRTFKNAGGVGYREERGTMPLPTSEGPKDKRFIWRFPSAAQDWNGTLIIGAHGGSGGIEYLADGTQHGTAETALDDLVGLHAADRGYAYASADRDGIPGTREGLTLTDAFTKKAQERVKEALGRAPDRTYIVGLSMGGGIARYAEEDPAHMYDGALLIAGARGDVPSGLDRTAEIAGLWPKIDPVKHPDLPDTDRNVEAYAKTVATPVAARAFWPFVARGATYDALRKSLEHYGLTRLTDEDVWEFRFDYFKDKDPFAANVAKDNTSGRVLVPTIEVAGTFDDIVIREVLAYQKKVAAAAGTPAPSALHRLYLVDGVWHISGDDDAAESFQYAMKNMGIGETTQQALRRGLSYIPTVRDALDRLDRWVKEKIAPPASQTVKPGEAVRP